MIPGIAHVHSVSTVFDGRMLKYRLTPPAYQRQLRYWRELLLLYGLWKLKIRSSIFWYDTMRGSKSTWHASVWSPMLRYATPDDLVPPVYPTRVASTPCTRAILSSGVQNLQWERAPSTPAAGILVSADTAPPQTRTACDEHAPSNSEGDGVPFRSRRLIGMHPARAFFALAHLAAHRQPKQRSRRREWLVWEVEEARLWPQATGGGQ